MSPIRTLAPAAFIALSLAALVVTTTACDQLLGGAGEQVMCDITGEVVGADGEAVTNLDIGWFPMLSAGQSAELISVDLNENSFTITTLVISPNAQTVEGELGFGDIPRPPFPIAYDQVRVPIDLPKTACNQDLGVITLPLRGTSPVNNPNNGADVGTDATTDTGADDAAEADAG